MSFDLAVWHGEAPLTAKAAGDVYVHLCEDWPYLEGEHASIALFYDELTKRWPEIDMIPEERIDELEFCPWSCALGRSGMAVVMNCVWSMADEVGAFVGELARKHSLVLYDPQSDRVDLPDNLRTPGNEIPKG